MATTRTPGITVLADGRRFIDKRYLGVRLGLRVGAVTQEQAEERLRGEMARVESDLARKSHVQPTFTDCAARYIEQSRGKRSIDIIKWHVSLLQTYIGQFEPQQVHDQTLQPFIKGRLRRKPLPRADGTRMMNNNGWRQARHEARLPLVRVHDLRHSHPLWVFPYRGRRIGKIVKLCWATPTIRWPAITRAPMSDASSSRRISY